MCHAEHIGWTELHAGRLLHIRMFLPERALDVVCPPGYGATDSTSSQVHDIDVDRRNQTNHASSFVLPLGHLLGTSYGIHFGSTLRGGFGIRRNRFNKLTGSYTHRMHRIVWQSPATLP